MEESVTYQAVLAKGEAKGERRGALREARKTLLLGRERFGAPGADVLAGTAPNLPVISASGVRK